MREPQKGQQMDLTGYGYRRSALRQDRPEATTVRRRNPPSHSPELTGEALRLLIKVDKKVGLQELSLRFPDVLNRIANVLGQFGTG